MVAQAPNERVDRIPLTTEHGRPVPRYSLDNVRADGWLEKLGEGSPSFGQLCEVMGERFVAFSIVAGLRIAALSYDSRSPERSMVEIDLGDGGKRARIAMGELQVKLASAMIDGPTPEAAPLPEVPGLEELQAVIGYRWVLLAPLFHMRLTELVILGVGRTAIAFEFDGQVRELPLDLFREHLRDQVRTELERLEQRRSQPRGGSPFAIDLALVPRALAHADAGEHAKVVELLGSWPGPLSVLLRTAEGQNLTPEARAQIARGLGVLGSAHARLARTGAGNNGDWALEVLRLGIQWAQDGEAARDLFLRLGMAYLDADRDGEAIGLLRRALELGAPEAQVAAPLARAFTSRGRHLAALAWAGRARRLGAPAVEIEGSEQAARNALGAPLAAWEAAR